MTKKLLMLICMLSFSVTAFSAPNFQLNLSKETLETTTEIWVTSSDGALNIASFTLETSSKYSSNWSTSDSDDDCDYDHDGDHDGEHDYDHDGEHDYDHDGDHDYDHDGEHDHNDDCHDNDDENSHPSAVPEPATMLLFGLGMAGAGITKKFRSKK